MRFLVVTVGLTFFCARAGAATVGLFPATLSENTTGQLENAVLGPPDFIYLGLGGQSVTYDFGTNRVLDLSGGDFNVYERSGGLIDFSMITVEVSLNGSDFFDVTATAAPGIDLIGAESHLPDYIRSFDLSGSGLSEARYIRIDGTGDGPAGSSAGFELEALGAVNFGPAGTPTPLPAPAAFGPGLLLIGAMAMARRRRLRC